MQELLGIITLLLVITVVGVGLAAQVVLCQLVFPRLIVRAQRNAERMPIRSFFVGLINLLFFGLLTAAVASLGEPGRLLALILLTILLGFIAVGLAAVARMVGERFRPDAADPIQQGLAGIVLLELAALVPIVGWVGVPVLAGLIGYGATIIAIIWKRAPADLVATDEPIGMEFTEGDKL